MPGKSFLTAVSVQKLFTQVTSMTQTMPTLLPFMPTARTCSTQQSKAWEGSVEKRQDTSTASLGKPHHHRSRGTHCCTGKFWPCRWNRESINIKSHPAFKRHGGLKHTYQQFKGCIKCFRIILYTAAHGTAGKILSAARHRGHHYRSERPG